jgi:hypothetical protein
MVRRKMPAEYTLLCPSYPLPASSPLFFPACPLPTLPVDLDLEDDLEDRGANGRDHLAH